MRESKPLSWALMLDAAWRAGAYCLHPRVIYLSLLPLLLAAVTLGALAHWGWADGVAGVRALLDQWDLSHAVLAWLDRSGFSGLRMMMAPLLLLLIVVPVVVVFCLLLVGSFMTPALTELVRKRRFAGMVRQGGASWWRSLAWSLGSSVVALILLVLSLPLWWLPWIAMFVPPLIWGWLTYRVLAFDTLSGVASPDERRTLLGEHRTALLAMGVACGYLGAAPAALWALGAMAIVLAPILLVVSVWLYMLVFAFSSLWFAHYLLAALHGERERPRAGPLSHPDITS